MVTFVQGKLKTAACLR